ncbi:universal stress protein (UspA) [Acanthamoeba castellanii str. Neff]|uniref:Universal stress protein (UspA) n=1 Tax=Acanthamoeba castellanii (strain ATCC 30010 / Neff) TaxID=1257118 RepID=L8GJ01_ACACF|nr:universal stress protein (UspA) [Acanthamoeba castellanii str. Neff]ELR12987.1 universal stress protein (UspA) [Acanthamoeba castellanii str. Neff]
MKYLLAYDGSSNSKQALDLTIKLLKPTDDQLVVLTVTERIPQADWPFFGDVWPKEEEAKQLTQKRKDANDAILEEVRAPLNEHNISYTLMNKVSLDVRSEIMDKVEEIQPDILVLGARGLGTVRGLLMGSVSQYCARNSKVPVLVVPPHKDEV